ncbi:MAG: hypothetical protein ACPGJS_04395 [Flammeovirgaceae bacterium]
MIRYTIWGLLLVSLIGCVSDEAAIRQLIDEQGDVVQQKLELIEQIGQLDEEPLFTPVRDDSLSNQSLPRFRLFHKVTSKANAEVVFAQQFANLSGVVLVEVGGVGKEAKILRKVLDSYRVAKKLNIINRAASLYENQILPTDATYKPTPRDFQEAFQALSNLEYVVVVHQLKQKLPKLEGTNSFIPGDYMGEALIYDIKNSTCVNRFGFKATNSKKISSFSVNDQSLSYYHLIKDFNKNIQQAFRHALESAVR